MDEVWAAADAVLALGERPTIERVRQQLGRGSPNTVGPMLDGWYGALAKRLQAPGDAAEHGAGAEAPLPAPVIRAAKALWGRALQHADERAAAQFTRAREELSAQAEALRRGQESLAQETQRLADRSEAYGVAMQAKDAQIAELGRLVRDLQQQLASNQELLAAARSDSVQLRLAAEADRRRQEAKEVEHQAERTRQEERAQAQERRLNAEVDRSRQESKRLSLQLDGDNRKYATSLSDSQDRARELEAHVGALQADKAGLVKDLQAARDETKALQAKFDERSNEMFAVLNELRDRLPPNSPGDAKQPTAKTRKTRS
ncbi:DNA-binding protein [Acidovorax sp. A1169]|uniref:DNA-binding protein n=1 Tax=Acidovorax sp. A1169 TaxID=3059524 RepID=UPI002737BB90|nr:DNA-binding protein [Acidovorax sp. A1169]MDP4074000.1 DNA-binding protein [Acidovorax sp. A1169]